MLKKQGSFQSNELNTVNIKCRIEIDDVELLNKHFGHARYVYNWAIDYNKARYNNGEKTLNAYNLSNLLPAMKKDANTSFLKEVDATCLQQTLHDYWEAMQRFFARKGGYPHFKTKYGEQSCRIMNVNNRIKWNDNGDKLQLGKFGWVRTKPNQSIPKGSIQYVTIKRNKWGKVFATLTIRRDDVIATFVKTGNEVGIDVGVKNFANFSDGTVIPRPAFISTGEKKKRQLQRQLSRKKLHGKNYQKAQAKLAKFCEKDTNRRHDFTHKLALDIVRNYDFIAVEHLDIKNMLSQNGGYHYKMLHRLIGELGWNQFLLKLKYKSAWYGKEFVQISTQFPSSQICSHCGHQNPSVKNLNIRQWACPQCNTKHDRDYNAAKNILNEGKRIASNAI
jgi:putative transposase